MGLYLTRADTPCYHQTDEAKGRRLVCADYVGCGYCARRLGALALGFRFVLQRRTLPDACSA